MISFTQENLQEVLTGIGAVLESKEIMEQVTAKDEEIADVLGKVFELVGQSKTLDVLVTNFAQANFAIREAYREAGFTLEEANALLISMRSAIIQQSSVKTRAKK